MEAVNGVADGPPPPSPLTGCYLLVVLGEPHTGSHKDIILQRLAKGLLSWNVNDCLVDLEKELSIVTEQGLEGEEARYGERLIQYASENLVTEILIHPSVSTLAQCVRNLLSSFTRHRHIIHAGYTFAANGSWVLQDGTFSLADFSEAFQEVDVQRVIHAYENGISIDIHCSAEGDWTKLPKESFTKGCKLRINPDDVLGSGLPAVTNFVNYIAPFLIPAELEHTLESSDVVGNIRFSRPTLYVFPGGQGDAALFGINGFNMLVDGGFSRKACFWDFVRHLDRLDAVILTRLNNSNANGIGAVLRRKAQNAVYPQIGHFFCNIQSRKANLSPDGDKDSDPLLINLLEEGHELISNLRSLDLSPQLCYRDTEPINLYHKVGHGTLDMYVLNPAKDSREVKEFLLRWNNNDQKLFANHKFSREYMLPLQNIVSICALLVWRPANPNDTITRILFPGSAPQGKVIEGLDKLKNLECIKHTVCTERTLVPPSKLKSKENILDKIVAPEKSKLEAKKNKIKPTPENKIIENNMKNGLQNGHTERQVTKASSVESDKSETKSTKPKREEAKVADNKQEKVSAKPKADTNISKTKQKASDKKVSPPTPKKVIDTKKSEIDKDSNNQRARSKISPSATPAKSTKDANNRKVLESKTKSTAKKDTKETKQPEKREEIKKFERKPISRRPKNEIKLPQSPVKRVVNGVHKPDSLGRKGKLDKEGTTDSSTVSTPSVDQDSLMKKDISKLTPEEVQQLKAQELAELKEEQEAIKELEAVFRKGDKINIEESDLREIKDTSIEDKTEPEEYLIVEKETIEPTPSETEIKEEETVKLARDSEESEKRKDRDEGNDEKDKQVDTEQEESGIGEQETDIEDGDDIRDNVMSKEPSVLSPEENKRFISKEDELKESQPEEKISANIESGATTTAPTLPEDERIPLNEIKEDTGDQIEEKHVREETKEKETKEELPVITLTSKPKDNLGKVPTVVGIRLDKESRIRDIVKTPDEVADLPVHEEADVDHLDEYVLEGTEKTKLKDITLEIDSLVKHETSEEDERIDKQEHKDEQHERKPEKLHIHDDEEIESPENKGEIVKDDFESKHTPKESDKIVQEITEQKKPTTEIVAESIQEDQPLNDQAPEKEHKLVDKEKLDVKEMIIQPALDEEQIPKDVKADMKEKKGEIPTEDISTSSKKDKDVPEQKEVISSIIPISGEAIEKKTHVKSEIHEKESKGVEDATHDDDGSQIRSPPGKEKVVESEDLTKVEQDIISKETVADEEDRIHVEALDKLAQTPQKEEVAEKPQFKDTKTIPISSDVEEIYDDIESKIIPKEEKHTEQDISEEKIEKAVGSVKVDEEKIHEPLIEKHSPAASDKESPKLEKEEIAVVEKDKTENILDKAIKDIHLGVESVLDENQVGTTEEKEKNLLGDLMATKVDDKKEHIQEVLKEKHDSEIDAKQASPQKEVFITKMIPDEHSKKIEPIEDEIKNEVPAVASDKNDIGMNQQLTHDEELKAEYSSDETRVEQKLEVKTHVESADALSKEVELPKDNEVVIEHLDEKIELYEEQAVESRADSKTVVVPLEKLDSSGIKLSEDLPTVEKETIFDKTDSELASKIVEKAEETIDEKPLKILGEAIQEKTEEKHIKDESHPERKHKDESLSAELPTEQETHLLSTKEHIGKFDEKEMDSSVMNLKIEDSKTDSSEKIEKSLSPEPPTTSKLEKEMKESDLKNIKLEKPVPTTHELEKKRKDSSEMSHEIIESSLHVEEKDGLEDKSRSPEKEKSPSKSPEQKEQEVHPLAFEDTKAIPLKDDIELKKDSSDISIDNIESRIHPEENEPAEVTKHDEKEKSSITEPSAKQILEQSTLEMKKEEEISGITTHKEQDKSPSPSLSQQKIEPLTIKDEKTDSTKDDSKIKRGEKLDSKIPYSDQSAVQEIESTLDVKKITPTSDDSSQKIEEPPVCIPETIESKPLVEPTVSPDKSKLDDKEKSPIPSLEHTEKEEIEPVIADTKTIPLTEDSKTIHLTEPGLHVDQNSSKLEEQKSPSPPSNQFTEETISPKTLKDTKSIHVEDSDEKNKESPKTKTEAISSKSGHEEQKVQEIPEIDEMKRSPSPSSEQSADQLSVESKIVSPITELPNKKEDVSVIEALASKEDREEHKTQGITEHDEDNLSASPERTLKLLSSEEKDEIIPIKDEVRMKKADCSEIAFDSKEDVESKISPEHDKKSEKETPPISEKDGDGSITPSPDKSVKEEKHSAESTLAVIDSKIEPIQKESAELLTSDSKIESVSATPDSEVEKMVSGKDDLGNIESKEEKKPQAHIEQYEVEKSLISPELTSKKEIEPEVSETKVDEELIRTTTVLETKDTPERIQDSVEDFKHEKEKPSSPSTDMLKKDASEMPDEHSEIGGKITPSQSSVLPIKQEEKDEVESSLHKKEKEDKIPTTTDVLEKEDDSKTSPEITESKEKSEEEKFEVDSKHDEKEKLSSLSSEMPSKQDVETTISKEKLDGTAIPTAEKPLKLEEKAVIKEAGSLEHSKLSSSPTEIIAKQEQVQDMKSETEKDSTQPTEDPLDKINKDISSSLESKSHPEDIEAQEQSEPEEKEKTQTLTEPMESKDPDNKNEEIAKIISPTTTTQDKTLVKSGDEKSVFLPHENIKDVSVKKMDGESDTKTAEGESKEKVTEEPFLPFLSKRASLLEEAEVPTKYSEKEETIDSKDINLNQEYHLPLKSEEIAQEVVKDETEEIHDSALKPKEEKDMKVSSAETTELSEILENLIRDADPDSVLEECKKDDEVGSQILDGITDQISTEKLDNEEEPLPEAEKVYIEDQVEQAKSKDVESRIVKEIQLDDIHNFIHQERSHTHREMESSVTDIKTDKKVEDVEKPVTEKPLDELQAKTIEAGIQSVQEFKEDKEETVSSSTDSNKIDIEKDKETKSNLDHRKELKLEAVEHIEDENKLEKGMMEAKEKDEDEEHDRAEVKCESEEPLMKTEKIKIDLTDKPEHAEAVLLKSTPESPVINVIPSLPALPTDIDKMELGRKSPKEREEDVAKIVASVATVLKSDAPLEEFHGKIPLTTNTPYGAYTTELRETHITTCDSPVHDSSILHEEPHQEATEEKIESSHSLEGKDDEKLDDHGLIRIDESEDPGTVHRMLVTASSEDGGEEIEICPAGTITFSKSSESSGRSSPENVSRKPSQSSSALDTISDHTTVKELVESQPKKEEIEEHASKTSIEHLQSSGESVKESETPKLYPELDIKKGIESLEDQIECKVSSSKKQDEPSEMQYSSDTSKEISQDTKEIHETVSDKVHSIFGSILSSASKIEETISHAITDTIHSAESTIDEGLKKVESEIDEVKHKITKIESDAVESLSEKKEKAEQLISDRLKESASSLEKVFDETDKEKNSLIQDAQTTLTRISAPLKDTFGDLLSNVVDSIKDKDDSLITAEDEKIVKSGEITIDEIQKVKEKPIPDEGQKETKSTETEKPTPEPSSNLYPSLESEMKEEGKEFDILTSTQTTKDATKSDASTHEEKFLPTVDDVKGETDDTVKKGEKSEKVPSRQSEKTAPIILNGLDNEENVSDKTDAERSVDSGSTFKDEKQKHQVPISHDILSTKLPEIKSDVDEGTETPQKKIISEIIPDAQYKSNVADSKISSPVDTINEPLSSPQKSLEAQQIPSTLQHDIDSISSSVENIKDSAKDLQKEIIKDLEEKKITLVDYTKDSLKGSKDKHESLIHKTEDSVKELEEKIVDLKEKQESVIDEIKDSVKDLEEELVEDLKERQESVVDKTKDFVKDLKEQVVEDSEEKQKSLVHKTSDSVKDLEEKILDLQKKQESVIDKTKDSVKDFKEDLVEDFKEKQQFVIPKTKDLVKDLQEELVEDLKERQQSVVDKTKDLKEQVVEHLEEKQKYFVDNTRVIETEAINDLKDLKDSADSAVHESKEKLDSVIDKTKDSVKDLKEKQESLVHKTADLVKDLEENIADLKEKQDSVIDKTQDSVKDLEEKVVEDLKETQELLAHKTADSVKDLEEKIVEDLKEKQESFVDNTKAIETKAIKDLKDSADSAVHESKEKLDSVSTEVASVLQDSKNTLTDFSRDIKEVAKLSKENLESSVTTIADEAEKTTKSFLSDITSTIGKALPSFGFSQKEEESKHIENQKQSEEELNKDKGTEKKVDVEISEKCDKTKQDTPSVITDISSIVKEEIESSFKDLIEVEKDATKSIAQESSNFVDSLKSVEHTALEAGQTVKEDTGKVLEEVKDKSVGLLIEGKEKVLQKTSDFESEIEGTKKAIHEKIEDISKNVKDAKENLEGTLSNTKGTIESSLNEVVQDIEKEKDALKSVGKEIQSELKHAVDDVLSSGMQLFGGIFGKKKQDSVEEKPSLMKKEEQHDGDSKIKVKAEEKKRIGDDHEQIQIHSDHHDSTKDTLFKSPKIETACEETIQEKYDTEVDLEKGTDGSVPDSCDASKVNTRSCLEVSPSYEKKLSISDVEIIVGEKLKDSSSDSTITEQILRKDKLCTSKPYDISHTTQLRDDTAIVGEIKDEILDTKTTPGSSTVDKHITDLHTTESSSKEDVRSITLLTDDLKTDKPRETPISPVLKSPTQIHSEKTMDSDDDSLGSARSMSSQVPLCKNMDPMSMSFYGALPDEEDFLDNDENDGGDYESGVSFVHLHDITKAKVDGKLVEGSTSEDEKPSSTDKFPVQDPMTSSFYGELPGGKDEKDPIESWGKPLGLPSPAPPNERGTPKKERRLPSNVMAKNRINDDFARSESPSKNKKKINPVYVDLTYVPHHGNSNYAYVDFFKKVRARYYVFSGIEPSREVYNALLEAKQTWEDKDLEVTIIPTYDTDVLGYWVAENEELLAKYKIDLSPSASRCTINLQDHETSCSAYRLEF